jgi:signal transduction histidine kinase
MTLRLRLLLLGAVLPALALALTIAWATYSFRQQLQRDLDRRMLALAAVESNSLFDGPLGEPHLHLQTSPLLDAVSSFLSETALYGPDGQRFLHFPQNSTLPQVWSAAASSTPSLSTTEDGVFRQLSVAVMRPTDKRYVLVIQSALAPLEETVNAFVRRSGFGATCILSVSVLLILWQASRLTQRVRGLTSALGGDGVERVTGVGDEIEQVREALTSVRARERATSEARERLLANAAHQLKTPLAVLQTELDLATRRTRSADETREVLLSAQREVRRLGATAKALLDYEAAHLQALQLDDVDLGPLVAGLAERFVPVARQRRVALTAECAPGAWVQGSAVWLEQAVSNVIDNALRYAPTDTSVVLRVQSTPAQVVITIRDHGPGITEAQLARVFEPFAQIDLTSTGVGLGLAITQEVVKKHGGQVRIETPRDGGGVRVQLVLPARASTV